MGRIMATYYNDKPIPFFLRLTGTMELNDKQEERQEPVYYQVHKSSSDTFHLLTDEEIKRSKDE